MTTTATILLTLFNFFAIIVFISLISSKFSNYVINNFNITNSTMENIKQILIKFNLVVVCLSVLFSQMVISKEFPIIKFIVMGIILVVDGICVICLSAYSKVQKKLNN
ncbi:hypothetical protein [Clostridium estertheticum]|uniref:DUF3784 domain-containing protein n=1 Tax=Clostridium estertheticum TaxID=238834 RepID=A0AA47I9K9_9CLOT|nr:hypothetical protein [Clostridium estertheticum]MBU3157659.1 hypothetical protein [Clostridium estertheticum]WAG62559.1 hypothetical protein LL038_10105 [Clostridium estertheticum]